MINFTILFENLRKFSDLKDFIDNIFQYTHVEDKIFSFVFKGYDDDIVEMFKNYVSFFLLEKNYFIENVSFDILYQDLINVILKNNIEGITIILKDNIGLNEPNKNYWIDLMLKNLSENKIIAVNSKNLSIEDKVLDLPDMSCVMFFSFIFGFVGALDCGYKTSEFTEFDFLYRFISNKDNEFIFMKKLYTDFPVEYREIINYNKSDLDRDKKRMELKFKLDNERAIVTRYGPVRGYEFIRYNFLQKYLKDWVEKKGYKPKILEIGCGIPFYLDKVKDYIDLYTGIDYNLNCVQFDIIEFADLNFVKFINMSIDELIKQNVFWKEYDLIIAFEVLEHIDNMDEILKILIDSNISLLLSTPYNEPPGVFEYHKQFYIKEDRYLKFSSDLKFYYQTYDGEFFDNRNNLTDNIIKNILVVREKKYKSVVLIIKVYNSDYEKLDIFLEKYVKDYEPLYIYILVNNKNLLIDMKRLDYIEKYKVPIEFGTSLDLTIDSRVKIIEKNLIYESY